jgi:hypothetical protein
MRMPGAVYIRDLRAVISFLMFKHVSIQNGIRLSAFFMYALCKSCLRMSAYLRNMAPLCAAFVCVPLAAGPLGAQGAGGTMSDSVRIGLRG